MNPYYYSPFPPPSFLPLPMDVDDDVTHANVSNDATFINNLFSRSHSDNNNNNNPSLRLTLGLPHSNPNPDDVDLELGLGFAHNGSDASTSTSVSDSQRLGLGLGLGYDPPTCEALHIVASDSDSDSGSDSDVGLGVVTDFNPPPWDYFNPNNINNNYMNHGFVPHSLPNPHYFGFNHHMNDGFVHHSCVESPEPHFVTHYDHMSHGFIHHSCVGSTDFNHCIDFNEQLNHGIVDDVDPFTHYNQHYHYNHGVDGVVNDGHGTIFPFGNPEIMEDRQVSTLFDSYRQRRIERDAAIPAHTHTITNFDIDDAIRDLELEILMAVNNFNREVYEMDLNSDVYDAILPEVDEGTDENGCPTAESVIQNLTVVRLSADSLKEKSIACAICKDDFVVEEEVRQLPCSHYYHGDCIVPWLEIRNTCPVCRYELPIEDLDLDDPKVEIQGTSSTSDGDVDVDVSGDSEVGVDFHVFL